MLALDRVRGLPLGIRAEGAYEEAIQQLQAGDQIIFYTDGITEALNPEGELFGTERLDQVLENCSLQASALLDSTLRAIEDFAAGRPLHDDRTLIVARIV